MSKKLVKIEDDVQELQLQIEKAALLSQDLCNEYFDRHDQQSDGTAIVWEFNRNRVTASMLHDYINSIDKTVNGLIKSIKDVRCK